MHRQYIPAIPHRFSWHELQKSSFHEEHQMPTTSDALTSSIFLKKKNLKNIIHKYFKFSFSYVIYPICKVDQWLVI